MLALAALSLFAACWSAQAQLNHTNFTGNDDDVLGRAVTFIFGDERSRWPRNIVSCAATLGTKKCINAFTLWRADNALDSFEKYGGSQCTLEDDLEKFPWETFVNTTEDVLEEKVTDSTAKLLQLKPLKLSLIPGYLLELDVRKNGSLNVDVYKRNEQIEESRGMMKKIQKRFYQVVPFLMVPGLIMSAILPFILPALKMKVMFVGLLNQMALTGAVFSLLRDNAFNDYYEKKIIYTNKGYKNEKHSPIHTSIEEDHTPPLKIHVEEEVHTHEFDDGFYHGANDAAHSGSIAYKHYNAPDLKEAHHAASIDYTGAHEFLHRAPIKDYAKVNDYNNYNVAPNDFHDTDKPQNSASDDNWSAKIPSRHHYFNRDVSPHNFAEPNRHPGHPNGYTEVNDFSEQGSINDSDDSEEEASDDDLIHQYYGGEGLGDVIGQHPSRPYHNVNQRQSLNKKRKARLKKLD